MTMLSGTCALITVVALWALYFASSDHLVNQHIETTFDPILAGRLTLTGEKSSSPVSSRRRWATSA